MAAKVLVVRTNLFILIINVSPLINLSSEFLLSGVGF